MALLREHRWLVAIVVLAAALRVAVYVAYGPAFFFADSWGYVAAGYSEVFMADAIRPGGYPLLLWALALPGRSLAVVTAAQHLAGLAVAVLAYALVLRLSGRRPLALVAAGLLALDAHLIALEHFVMPEALFTLMLFLGLALTVLRRDSLPWLAVAGALLAAAVCTRPVALFALPVWLAYLAWSRVPLRTFAAGAVALALPLFAYLAVHQHNRGEFSFTSASGWLMYGRVGPIVKCGGLDVPPEQRPLCAAEADRGRLQPVEYIFGAGSPAVRLYGGISADHAELRRSDAALRDFSARMIRHRPFAYARMVAGDTGRFMWPGFEGSPGQEITVRFPEDEGGVVIYEPIRAKYVPGYRFREDPPAAALRAYASVMHTPRWLIGPLLLARFRGGRPALPVQEPGNPGRPGEGSVPARRRRPRADRGRGRHLHLRPALPDAGVSADRVRRPRGRGAGLGRDQALISAIASRTHWSRRASRSGRREKRPTSTPPVISSAA